MAFLLPTIRAVSGTPDSSVTLPEDQQIVSMVGCFMNSQPLVPLTLPHQHPLALLTGAYHLRG